jgi:uncharacterized membrane protein
MQSNKKVTVLHRVMRAIRRHFLAGIIVVVPLAATLAILIWFFINVDNILHSVYPSS